MVGLEARDLVLGLLSTSTIGVGPQVVAPPLKTAGLLGRLATLAVSSTTRDSGFLLRLELLDLIGIAALSRVKDLGAFAAIGRLGPCRADSNSDGHQRGHHSAEASQAAALVAATCPHRRPPGPGASGVPGTLARGRDVTTSSSRPQPPAAHGMTASL